MKIIVTTSPKYYHLLPVFCYLFVKNWSAWKRVEIVGYDRPDFELPAFCTFHSLGKQTGGAENFSTDLRKYFEQQDDFFAWMMEDTFIRDVYPDKLETVLSLLSKDVGRINLCSRATKLQEHFKSEYNGHTVLENTQRADYRLCTQPSIWNKKFLLKYMTPGLTPWKFETQSAVNDGYRILGLEDEVVIHNEGVTKHNIWKLDLHGIPVEQIKEMETLGILTDKMEYDKG